MHRCQLSWLQSCASKVKNSGSVAAYEISCIYGSNQKLALTRSVSASQKENSSCRSRFSLMVTVLNSALVAEDDECWENVFALASVVVVVEDRSHEFET